jgi:hypothetical protein
MPVNRAFGNLAARGMIFPPPAQASSRTFAVSISEEFTPNKREIVHRFAGLAEEYA